MARQDNAGHQAQQRLLVQESIQYPKVAIDYTVFKKTFSERIALRKAKAAYKRSVRAKVNN